MALYTIRTRTNGSMITVGVGSTLPPQEWWLSYQSVSQNTGCLCQRTIFCTSNFKNAYSVVEKGIEDYGMQSINLIRGLSDEYPQLSQAPSSPRSYSTPEKSNLQVLDHWLWGVGTVPKLRNDFLGLVSFF